MSEKQIFKAILEKHEKLDATGITIPFDVEAVFGSKKVPVKVVINNAEYRGTIARMGGKYIIGVPKVFREAAGVLAGETITITVEEDTQKRIVEVPPDFVAALAENKIAEEKWKKLSYTYRKEYARSIEEAKKAETRARRIEKAIKEIVAWSSK